MDFGKTNFYLFQDHLSDKAILNKENSAEISCRFLYSNVLLNLKRNNDDKTFKCELILKNKTNTNSMNEILLFKDLHFCNFIRAKFLKVFFLV
jgi:hypothetical protein